MTVIAEPSLFPIDRKQVDFFPSNGVGTHHTTKDFKMFASKLIYRFSSRSAVTTTTVRAVKRRSLIPTRAALTLVCMFQREKCLFYFFNMFFLIILQTPMAVQKIKELVNTQPKCVST